MSGDAVLGLRLQGSDCVVPQHFRDECVLRCDQVCPRRRQSHLQHRTRGPIDRTRRQPGLQQHGHVLAVPVHGRHMQRSVRRLGAMCGISPSIQQHAHQPLVPSHTRVQQRGHSLPNAEGRFLCPVCAAGQVGVQQQASIG